MSQKAEQKSRLKRLPMHSFSIILSFGSDEERDKCINSKEFKEIFGKLTASALSQTNFNMKIETIQFDIISGKKNVEKGKS